jgi:hypothetical protein
MSTLNPTSTHVRNSVLLLESTLRVSDTSEMTMVRSPT